MQHNPYAVGAFIVVGLVLLLVVYQALVVVPQNKIDQETRQTELKLDAVKLAESIKKMDYHECLDTAYKAYSADWDSQCVIAGAKADFNLMPYQYKEIEKRHTTGQSTCLTIYTAK